MIAITRIARGYAGADYYAKQIVAGKTPKEARRLLRRRVSDRVFKALIAEEQRQTRPATTLNKTGRRRGPVKPRHPPGHGPQR